MLLFLDGCSVTIGGPNRTVKIDESTFSRRKYHRGHPVKGQWVFGGVERETGETFLVPVKDRTADTLMAIIRDWIEPGTTVISDCWAAYNSLGSQGYSHQTVNHSIQFVDPNTGTHTNTIESMWHRVEVFHGQYNHGDDYECARYLYKKSLLLARHVFRNNSCVLSLYFLTLRLVSIMCVIYTSKGMSKKFGMHAIYRKIRYLSKNLV
jgi:transposase-like protein